MKVLITIVLSLLIVISSLVLMACCLCAFSSGVTTGDRVSFTLAALIALGFDIGAIVLIGRINRPD